MFPFVFTNLRQIKMVGKDGRSLSTVKVDLESRQSSVDGREREMEERNATLSADEARLVAKAREVERRSRQSTALANRLHRREAVVQRRDVEASQRETAVEQREAAAEAAAEAAERTEQRALMDAAKMLEDTKRLGRMEEECKKRTQELNEQCRVVEEGTRMLEQRESNLALDWAHREREREQANAASRIQTVFRAMTMTRVGHQLREMEEAKRKTDARHTVLRENTRSLQKSWDAVRSAENRAQDDAASAESQKEEALQLHRRCQAEARELAERRRSLEDGEETTSKERAELESESRRLRDTAQALNRQALILTGADKDLTARASNLVTRTQAVAKMERFANRIAAKREDLHAKGKRLKEREKTYLETQSRSSAMYRVQIDDLEAQLATALKNTAT